MSEWVDTLGWTLVVLTPWITVAIGVWEYSRLSRLTHALIDLLAEKHRGDPE